MGRASSRPERRSRPRPPPSGRTLRSGRAPRSGSGAAVSAGVRSARSGSAGGRLGVGRRRSDGRPGGRPNGRLRRRLRLGLRRRGGTGSGGLGPVDALARQASAGRPVDRPGVGNPHQRRRNLARRERVRGLAGVDEAAVGGLGRPQVRQDGVAVPATSRRLRGPGPPPQRLEDDRVGVGVAGGGPHVDEFWYGKPPSASCCVLRGRPGPPRRPSGRPPRPAPSARWPSSWCRRRPPRRARSRSSSCRRVSCRAARARRLPPPGPSRPMPRPPGSRTTGRRWSRRRRRRCPGRTAPSSRARRSRPAKLAGSPPAATTARIVLPVFAASPAAASDAVAR